MTDPADLADQLHEQARKALNTPTGQVHLPALDVMEAAALIRSLVTENERRLAVTESWIDKDSEHCQVIADLQTRLAATEVERDTLRKQIKAALAELGVPTEDYPAPIVNAVRLLRQVLDRLNEGSDDD